MTYRSIYNTSKAVMLNEAASPGDVHDFHTGRMVYKDPNPTEFHATARKVMEYEDRGEARHANEKYAAMSAEDTTPGTGAQKLPASNIDVSMWHRHNTYSDPDSSVSLPEAYTHYLKWIEHNGSVSKPVSMMQFHNRMTQNHGVNDSKDFQNHTTFHGINVTRKANGEHKFYNREDFMMESYDHARGYCIIESRGGIGKMIGKELKHVVRHAIYHKIGKWWKDRQKSKELARHAGESDIDSLTYMPTTERYHLRYRNRNETGWKTLSGSQRSIEDHFSSLYHDNMKFPSEVSPDDTWDKSQAGQKMSHGDYLHHVVGPLIDYAKRESLEKYGKLYDTTKKDAGNPNNDIGRHLAAMKTSIQHYNDVGEHDMVPNPNGGTMNAKKFHAKKANFHALKAREAGHKGPLDGLPDEE